MFISESHRKQILNNLYFRINKMKSWREWKRNDIEEWNEYIGYENEFV